MSNLKIYPLDLTGNNPSNKITGEIVTITNDASRVMYLTGGAFYTNSLKIYQGTRLLRPVIDYVPLELNRDATVASGKEVCNVLYIKNTAKSFTVTYQVVGGEYSNYIRETTQLFKDTPIDKLRTYYWGYIIDKPKTFPPEAHVHYPYEWRGYSEVIQELAKIRRFMMVGDHNALANTFNYIDENISEIVHNYITTNGLFMVSDVASPNGFLFLKGTGKSDNKLRIDYDELYKDLDIRYFQNSINPISRVGQVSDFFLPINSGYFNLISPEYFSNYANSTVYYIEKNGDLITLLPATNGEMIGYAYGYVKGWSSNRDIKRLVPTNLEYRHPTLAKNEIIGTLTGDNGQSLIANIYERGEDKVMRWKEHALIWLNGTFDANRHTMIRLGNRLKETLPANLRNNETDTRLYSERFLSYKPNMIKLANDKCYLLVHMSSLEIAVWEFNQDTLTFTSVNNWQMYDREIGYAAPVNDEILPTRVLERRDNLIYRNQPRIKPYKLFDTSPNTEMRPWFTTGEAEEGFNKNNFESTAKKHLILKVSRNTVHVFYGQETSFYYNYASGAHSRGRRINNNIAGLIDLNNQSSPKFYNYREYTADNPVTINNSYTSGYDTSDSKTTVNHIEYHPTMSGTIRADSHRLGLWNDDLAIRNCTILEDGTLVGYRHDGTVGLMNQLDTDTIYPNNGYDFTKVTPYTWFYLTAVKRTRYGNTTNYNTNYSNNLSRPAKGCVVFTLKDGTQLVRDYPSNGRNDWNRKNAGKVYGYRPSSKVIEYPLLEGILLQGYDTSDNSELLTIEDTDALYPGLPMMQARKLKTDISEVDDLVTYYRNNPNNVELKDSALVFHYTGSTAALWSNKAPGDLTVDWNASVLKCNAIHTLSDRVVEKINAYCLNMTNADGVKVTKITQWMLHISPLRTTDAILSVQGYVNLDAPDPANREIVYDICMVKLVIDSNRNINDIVIGHLAKRTYHKHVTSDHTAFAFSRLATVQCVVEYKHDMSEAIWLLKNMTGVGFTGDTWVTSQINFFRQNLADNTLELFHGIGEQYTINGNNSLISSPLGMGQCHSYVGGGLYRSIRPFNVWKNPVVASLARVPNKTTDFILYNPKPVANFKLTVNSSLELQLGGIKSFIPTGDYRITDSNHSNITNPRNKKILVYVTLELGIPKLWFSETSIAESNFNIYIGYLLTDNYGINEMKINPVTRLDNYRLSTTPTGSAISVSPSTPDKETYLNWDTGSGHSSSSTTSTSTSTKPLPVGTTSNVGLNDFTIGPGEGFLVEMVGGGGGGGSIITGGPVNDDNKGRDGGDTIFSIDNNPLLRARGGKGGTGGSYWGSSAWNTGIPGIAVSPLMDYAVHDLIIDSILMKDGNIGTGSHLTNPGPDAYGNWEGRLGKGGDGQEVWRTSSISPSSPHSNGHSACGSSGSYISFRMRNPSTRSYRISFTIGAGGEPGPVGHAKGTAGNNGGIKITRI